MQNGQIKDRHQAVLALRGAWWVGDRNVQRIFEVLDGAYGKTRAVGGLVRDTIVHASNVRKGGSGSDIDLATQLLPDEVVARARKAGMSCYPTGIKHGTVTIRNGDIVCEVTTLRRDIKTDGRHAVVEFGTDWEADARRRDFTINALYADQSGHLFDPIGGLGDLLARRVRFIGDPDLRIKEDRLRVFRFFRFTASHGGEICDREGLEACQRFSSDLGNLSAERVGGEMLKILALPKIGATLAAMTKISVLDFNIQSLEALARYEDRTGVHQISARLAILMESRDMDRMRNDWRLSNSLMNEAKELLMAAQMMIEGKLYQVAYRHGRIAYVALPVAAAIADLPGQTYRRLRDFWDNVQVPPFPISGDDLLGAGFVQGPELGVALRRIEGEWIASGFVLDRDEMLARLQNYLG